MPARRSKPDTCEANPESRVRIPARHRSRRQIVARDPFVAEKNAHPDDSASIRTSSGLKSTRVALWRARPILSRQCRRQRVERRARSEKSETKKKQKMPAIAASVEFLRHVSKFRRRCRPLFLASTRVGGLRSCDLELASQSPDFLRAGENPPRLRRGLQHREIILSSVPRRSARNFARSGALRLKFVPPRIDDTALRARPHWKWSRGLPSKSARERRLQIGRRMPNCIFRRSRIPPSSWAAEIPRKPSDSGTPPMLASPATKRTLFLTGIFSWLRLPAHATRRVRQSKI